MGDIRILTHDDKNAYKSLLADGNHAFNWDIIFLDHISNENLDSLLSTNQNDINVFGLFVDQELVASATLFHLQFVGRLHKATLDDIFVKNNSQEYNQELISYVIQYARLRGIEKLFTSVTSNNIGGKILLSSLGFESVGYEEDAYKIDDDYQDVHWLAFNTHHAIETD